MKLICLLAVLLCLTAALIASVEPDQTKKPAAAQTSKQKPSAKDDIQYITSDFTTSQNLPFSEAVRVGNVLYLSGNIGTIPGTLNLAPGGIEGETKQAMDNIGQLLEANGSSFGRVVKCTVMLADMKEWPDMNKIYIPYFPSGHLPARSAFGANGLARGARVEIECIAIVK